MKNYLLISILIICILNSCNPSKTKGFKIPLAYKFESLIEQDFYYLNNFFNTKGYEFQGEVNHNFRWTTNCMIIDADIQKDTVKTFAFLISCNKYNFYSFKDELNNSNYKLIGTYDYQNWKRTEYHKTKDFKEYKFYLDEGQTLSNGTTINCIFFTKKNSNKIKCQEFNEIPNILNNLLNLNFKETDNYLKRKCYSYDGKDEQGYECWAYKKDSESNKSDYFIGILFKNNKSDIVAIQFFSKIKGFQQQEYYKQNFEFTGYNKLEGYNVYMYENSEKIINYYTRISDNQIVIKIQNR